MKIPNWVCRLADLRSLQAAQLQAARLSKLSRLKFLKYWAIAAFSGFLILSGSIATQAAQPQETCEDQIQLAAQRSPLAAPSEVQLSEAQLTDQPVAIAQVSPIGKFTQALSPLLATQFAPPFPQINGIARIARVPILAYRNVSSNTTESQTELGITAADFEATLKQIQAKGVTPISLDQLTKHLSTGIPLPPKPILLTFDGGYLGHAQVVYPLLKRFGYPGVFAVYPGEINDSAELHLNWTQLRAMAADPLIAIASHGLTPQADLRSLQADRLREEVVESKRLLETKLGISVHYFVYPTAKVDDRIQTWVQKANYHAALTQPESGSDFEAGDRFAGESASLLRLERLDHTRLAAAMDQANGGVPLPALGQTDNFNTAVQIDRRTVDQIPLVLVSGGRPVTIHADSRYQVSEIIAKTKIAQATAIAAVDGGYFSLERLESNAMVGPVLSQNTKEFMPADAKELRRIMGRPLVLINRDRVQFVPFNPDRHNTLAGIHQDMPDVTDLFVAAAWLVRNGQPQPLEAFGNLYKVYEPRDRAFWGINYAGQPVIGVTSDLVDSISLGKALSKVGLRDVVMLDSGASTSLTYRGESMMSFEPRPVPHVVALLPLQTQLQQTQLQADRCSVVSRKD
jgi:poly-beta-1,6-N-acetyl-D-glucosamine N-deacetylase